IGKALTADTRRNTTFDTAGVLVHEYGSNLVLTNLPSRVNNLLAFQRLFGSQAKLFHLMLAALHGSINSTSTPEGACCPAPTPLARPNFHLRTPGAVSNAWRDSDPNVAAYLANVYNNGIHTTLYSNPNMYTVDYLAALSGDYRLWDRQNNEYRGNDTACPTSNCGP